jgi:hypothetical protein
VTAPVVFRPRPSLGWLWLVLVALLVWIIGLPPLLLGANRPVLATVLMIVIPSAIALPLLVLAVWFPTMRYELDDTELHLRYGPVIHYRIPLRSIRSIERRDLEPTPYSSIRVPGFALARVRYIGIGPVRMVATAAATNVVLLHTDQGLYGITPADDAAFVDAVRARIGT